jgi:hypothetical protein
MSLIAKITFIKPAQSGSTITFSWTGSTGTIATATETFKPTRSTNYETRIGTGTTDSAQYLYSALTLDFAANFNLSVSGNSVYVSSKNTSNPMSAQTTAIGVVINGLGLVNDLLSRSSELVKVSGNNYDTTTFKIITYEGDVMDAPNQTVLYTKTKSKLVTSQNNIWFNISNLVNGGLECDIDYYINSTSINNATPLQPNESKWSIVKWTNSLLGNDVETGYITYFTLDGFYYNNEEENLNDILASTYIPSHNTSIKDINRNSLERLYFKTNDLVGITYYKYNTPSTNTVSFISYSGNNKHYINSIKIDTNNNEDYVMYSLHYDNPFRTKQMIYYLNDECKFDKYDLVFKNKWGVLETLLLNKKTTKQLKVESPQYLRSIVDIDGNYDIKKHTQKQYNTTGEEEWTLNTPLLSEYMNETIKQAMLSNEIYLVDLSTKEVLPVIKLDDSLSYKTGLNDGLIQYTIKVKLSHKIIKNII